MHIQVSAAATVFTAKGGDRCGFYFLGFVSVLAGCARRLGSAGGGTGAGHGQLPVERDVTDYADFTGRTAAVDSVEVRARVWGYLDKVNFKEGALVKKGDVLFEIDPRPYQADLEPGQGDRRSE